MGVCFSKKIRPAIPILSLPEARPVIRNEMHQQQQQQQQQQQPEQQQPQEQQDPIIYYPFPNPKQNQTAIVISRNIELNKTVINPYSSSLL